MTNNWMKRSGKRITSEMIMRNAYKQYESKYYILVEGESDTKFFSNIMDTSICSVVELEGRPQVEDFIVSQNRAGKDCYVGIVDADFNNITRQSPSVDNVIQLDVHDVEMLILSQVDSYRKIYSEYAKISEVKKAEKRLGKCFMESVMWVAFQIGILKLTVQNRKFQKVSMKELPYVDFIDEDFNVDIDEIISRFKGRNSKDEIKAMYNQIMEKEYDKYQICCGHDVANILAIAFINKENKGWGYGDNKYLKKDHVESTLRTMYDYTKFKLTGTYKKLASWQEKRNINLLNIETGINVA